MTPNESNTQPSDLPNEELIEDAVVDTDVTESDDIASIEIDEEPKKPGRKKKTKEFYVNEAEFEGALRKFYETDVISNELADMIHKMVNGLAHRPNFINYTFRDEASGDALVNIMQALRKRKFVFGNSKPFSYFNAIAWNCWRNRIKREARRRTALAAYQDEVYGELLITPGTQQED
jgi:hypothetical protein